MTKMTAEEYTREVERRAVEKIEELETELTEANEIAAKAREHADNLKKKIEDARYHGKDRLWKCDNLSCGHIFEADHDKCPRCYMP